MKNKKILVIAYKFPPYPEVGSYRWSRFAKYFAKKKYKVHVVTVDWKIESYQTWEKDLKSKNIIIHKTHSNYIHNLKYKKFPKTFWGMFFNKLRNQILKVLNFIYYIDEAQFWGYSLLPYCKKIIKKEKIKYVIATGAPFMTNYWAARLKKDLPEIRLIQDLRDEWNEFRKFPISSLKKKSLEYESFALNNCDVVVTTSEGLRELFASKINNDNIKTRVVYNGFDKISIKPQEYLERDFSFLYAGSLSNDRDSVLYAFLDIVEENIKALADIKIYIYSQDYIKVIKKYKSLIKTGNLIAYGLIPQKKLFEEINKSFVTLHLMPETQKYIISIKLFEYGFFKRPILSLNTGGDTEEIMMKHNLGISKNYLREKIGIKNTLLEYYYVWKKNPKSFINPVGLEEYSYEYLSSIYLKILDELK